MKNGWLQNRKKWGCFVALGMTIILVGILVFPVSWPPRDSQVMAAATLDAETMAVESSGSTDGVDGLEKTRESDPSRETADMQETASAPIEKERKDFLIILDPGHGGEDEGCSHENIREKDINLQIAHIVKEKLKTLGYQVRMTRTEDETLSLEERVWIANEAQADLYISIHQNTCERKAAAVSGVEVWYNAAKAETGSERLAKLIEKEVLLYSEARERELVTDESLYVIRETDMPACLVETGFLSNKTERELLITEEYQDKIAKGIAMGIDLYFFPKTMYLTFDDGPGAENTAKILDILKEHEIKATFFLIGENVEKYPEIAKRIVEEGHTIGIHCYNHDYETLYQDVDSYVTDFEKAKQVVFEVTGVETKIFRFPGGSVNSYNKKVYQDIIAEMADRGYVYYDWNASLEDATRHNEPETLIRNACESTLGRKRVIMLAHDVVYNTTLCLDEIIEQFPEYRFSAIDDDTEPICFALGKK